MRSRKSHEKFHEPRRDRRIVTHRDTEVTRRSIASGEKTADAARPA
jgi:hypothetical protein